METTINERVNLLIDKLRMNPNSFAKAIGKSYTAIDGIIKGKSKPGYELLENIVSAFPEVNAAWLMAGMGEVFTKEIKPEPAPAPADNYLKEHLKTLEENFERLAKQLENKDRQIEGLQRTVDALISRPIAPAGNFLNDVAARRSVIRMHPATQLIVEVTGAVA